MKTFSGLDEDYNTVTHATARISLSRGEQGIPDGFTFEAVCGYSERQFFIDLEDVGVTDCAKCRSRR